MAPWEPGIRSPNPKGRPKGKEALTELLRAEAEELVTKRGVTKSKKQLLAETIFQAALTGTIKLQNKTLQLDSADWLKLISWLYSRVDDMPSGVNTMIDTATMAQVHIVIPSNNRDPHILEESEG